MVGATSCEGFVGEYALAVFNKKELLRVDKSDFWTTTLLLLDDVSQLSRAYTNNQ